MTIRIAIIGASFAQRAFLPALEHVDDTDVVAIASARLESARAAADAFSVSHAYDDWRRMLERHSADLVLIATPTNTHAPMTLAALDAGAHVVCEKPMAMDVAEARRMLDRAEELGRVHVIDHELRFNPNRREIRRRLADGAIGEVRHVQVVYSGSSWGDPASRPEGDWWSLASAGGGRLGAAGSHLIDLLRFWLGEVSAVSAAVRTMVPNRTGKDSGRPWTATADDFVQMNLEMASGALATLTVSGAGRHGSGNRIDIYGSDGTITLDESDETLRVAAAGESFRDISRVDPDASLAGIQQSIYPVSVVGLLREVVGAIREGRAVRDAATFADGVACQRVIDAARRSSEERRWIATEEVTA